MLEQEYYLYGRCAMREPVEPVPSIGAYRGTSYCLPCILLLCYVFSPVMPYLLSNATQAYTTHHGTIYANSIASHIAYLSRLLCIDTIRQHMLYILSHQHIAQCTMYQQAHSFMCIPTYHIHIAYMATVYENVTTMTLAQLRKFQSIDCMAIMPGASY